MNPNVSHWRWPRLILLACIFALPAVISSASTATTQSSISGPTTLTANTSYYYKVTSTVTITNTSSSTQNFRVQTNFLVNGVPAGSVSTSQPVAPNSTATVQVQNVGPVNSGAAGTKEVQSSTNVKNEDGAYIGEASNADAMVEVFATVAGGGQIEN